MKKFELLNKKYKKKIFKCDICNSKNYKIFQSYGRNKEPGEYGKVQILICKVCGLKSQNPRYSEYYYIEYYKLLYRKIAFGSIKPSSTYLKEQYQRSKGVMSFVNNIKFLNNRMLDHGCASGATMLPWIEKGWRSSGIDPHHESVKIAKKNNLNVSKAFGEKLPFQSKSFDLILSLGSIEHAYNLKKVISEMYRVLDNKGYLLIRWRSDIIFGSPLEYFNHNHYYFFTDKTIKYLLNKNNFSIIKSTSKKLEGWENYKYTLARKNENLKINFKFNENDYKNEIKKIQKRRKTFYNKCKKFLNFCKHNNYNLKNIYSKIRNKNTSFNWKILGNKDYKNTIQRSIMEAKKYIEMHENKMVK